MTRHTAWPLLLAAPLLFTACDDSATGPEAGAGRVGVRFGVAGGPQLAATPPGLRAQLGGSDQLVIVGTNGTLTITDLRVVVNEFELKRADRDALCGEDDHGERNGDDDGCEYFRAPPAFVDVPLGGQTQAVAFADVDPGIYEEMEFEVENLDDHADTDAERQQLQALLAQIRSQVADWPREASLLVVGSFTPTGGQPTPFRAFFEAEIEIELDLSPPLQVAANDNRDVTVTLDPAAWFRSGAQVVDLSRYDYERTRRVAEFELEIEHEMEDGFHGHGDDDDDHDDDDDDDDDS